MGATSWIAARQARLSNDVTAQLTELRRDVAALSRATHALPEQPSFLATAPLPGGESAVRPAIAPPPGVPPSAPVVQRAPTQEQYAASLQAKFDEDIPDRIWTVPVQRETEQRLQAALPEGSELRSLDCRNTMCRVESSHVDPAHYNEFVRAAFLTHGHAILDGAGYSVRTSPEGVPPVYATYIARGGNPLPTPDARAD